MKKSSKESSCSRQNLEEFKKELLTWEKFFSVLPDALICTDDLGIILCANKRAEDIFGYSTAEIIGQSVEFLIPMNLHDRHTSYREKYTQKPTPRSMGSGLKIKGLRKNGVEFPVDISLNHLIISGEIVIFALIRDITDILKTENESHENEKKFILTIQGIDEIIYSVKIDGNPNKGIVQFVTGRVEEILGIKPEKFINNSGLWFSLIHPDYVSDIVEQTNNLIKEKKSIKREYRIKSNKDAGYIWIEDKVFPQLDDSGNVVGLFGVARDITESKAEVERLMMQITILENVHDSVVVTDLDGKITYWNKGAEKIFGYSAEEMLAKTRDILFPPDSGYDLKADFATLKKGNIIDREWKRLGKDKKEIWLRTKRVLMRNKKGENIGYLGVSRDVTGQKLAEEEIKKLSLVVENTSDIVIITDTNKKIEWVNNGFIQVTGYTFDEIKGKKPSLLQGPDTDPTTIVYLKDRISKQLPFRCEILNYKKTGEKYWIETSGQPLFDESGKLMKWFSIERNVTEKKNAEKELIKAKEKAEQSDKLKTEFLAQVSHEIRTPLVSILGYAELLMTDIKEDKSEYLLEYLEDISIASKRMQRTFDLIINAAQIITNNFEPKFTSFNVTNEVFLRLNLEFKKLAEQKDLEYIFFDNAKVNNIIADKFSVNQLFSNLIDNAIKFTKQGFVKVEIISKDDAIWVSVIDSGIGISEEFLSLIFDPFRQEDQGYSREFEGNGLGLTLAKYYCEINNAELSVHSAKGKGSVFTVKFKLKM